MRSLPLFLLLLNCISSPKADDSPNSTTSLVQNPIQDTVLYNNNLRAASDFTETRAITYPCQCVNGECGCCTGNVLQNFNINIRQRVCTNMTYDPDEFAVAMRVSFNDNVFYKTQISGKNPPPACVPIPRITAIKFCVRLTNVYTIGRNIHACVVLETQWNKETAFAFNFDCVRLGADGVSVVRPEDGGGLPHPTTQEPDEIEEYDELIENQVKVNTTSSINGNKPNQLVKPNKPEKPEKPEKPDKPNKPEKPVKPDKPKLV